MNTISLTIDGKTITSRKGENVLWAALDNDIYIPNLCAFRELSDPYAGCRLCFVEIEGYNGPVTACTEPVTEGMVINTQGPAARRLARTSLELMLASHHIDCANCPRSSSCDLQKAAAHLGVKMNSRRFRKFERQLTPDSSSPVFTYNPGKCVLCGKCVWVCSDRLGVGVLGFAHRGLERVVTTFEKMPIAHTECLGCGDCVAVCPVGALVFKENKMEQNESHSSKS